MSFLFSNIHLFAYNYTVSSIPVKQKLFAKNHMFHVSHHSSGFLCLSYLVIFICLHTTIRFQVFLPYKNYLIRFISFMISSNQIDSNFIFFLGVVSLFNGISTFMVYLMPKLSLQKNSRGTIYPIAKGGEEFHTFSQVWFGLVWF